MNEATGKVDYNPALRGFLSSYESPEKVVSITPEPDTIHIEQARKSNNLNLDFTHDGQTEKKL